MNLFAHQQKLLDLNPSKYLLAWGTGTGKTGTALMLAQKNCDRFLVICPKTLKENWRREVVRWLGLQPMVFDAKHPSYGQITIISKEEFRKFSDVLPGFDGVIVDEAHTFAGLTSQLSKSLHKYFRKHLIEYRWFLTATPFLRNAFNIFVLGRLLDAGWDFVGFRHKFFYERYMGARTFWDARPGMEDELAKAVHQIGSTVKLSDCIDIPEATFETEYFKLTKPQEAAMKKVTEVLSITRFTKFHQICGGALKGNEYEPTIFIDSEKINRVKELAQENDKMIVSCRYLAEMEMLREVLKGHVVMTLDGSVSDKQAVLDVFNRHQFGILLVNAACSEGWSAADALVKYPTSLIVFYSYDFSLKNKIQMEGRVRRIDLPQKVTYIALVVEKSIDEAVVAALNRKMDFDCAIYNYQLESA